MENQFENQKKGGRIAKSNAEYFTMPGHRSDELRALKLEKGSLGVDIYLAIYEKICVSDYFLWNYLKQYKLKVFATDNGFDPIEFCEILEYMVTELGLFDTDLYNQGFVFSRQFVLQFAAAGLFMNRKIKAEDIFRHAESMIIKPNKSNDDEIPF
jgi:hypothetical protein